MEPLCTHVCVHMKAKTGIKHGYLDFKGRFGDRFLPLHVVRTGNLVLPPGTVTMIPIADLCSVAFAAGQRVGQRGA